MPIGALVTAGAFVGGMVLLSRFLSRLERDGDFDAGPSSASRPGLRTFFDFSERGWRFDGIRQRPPRR